MLLPNLLPTGSVHYTVWDFTATFASQTVRRLQSHWCNWFLFSRFRTVSQAYKTQNTQNRTLQTQSPTSLGLTVGSLTGSHWLCHLKMWSVKANSRDLARQRERAHSAGQLSDLARQREHILQDYSDLARYREHVLQVCSLILPDRGHPAGLLWSCQTNRGCLVQWINSLRQIVGTGEDLTSTVLFVVLAETDEQQMLNTVEEETLGSCT